MPARDAAQASGVPLNPGPNPTSRHPPPGGRPGGTDTVPLTTVGRPFHVVDAYRIRHAAPVPARRRAAGSGSATTTVPGGLPAPAPGGAAAAWAPGTASRTVTRAARNTRPPCHT
ncbi:hypothetical protein [Phytohabitans rumicis]|uniref:Uncharacterized protein n=1 Tax=Phytohabitans rumicis TaxID=1076125 RepID=A0A6V8LDG9_9ACTN|nr:hypothetical protein [Phytohabitans rumicis]GFJ95272.1 hypothetical protein Prum_089140 [Phytohabitans rumicis]